MSSGRRGGTAGAHPYLVTPEHTARARGILGEGPLLCPEQAVVLEADGTKAREIARQHVGVYLAQPSYVHSLREHLDAGADHVPVQVLPEHRRGVPDVQWRELAAPLTEIARRPSS